MGKRLYVVAAILSLMLSGLWSMPARAGQVELDLLTSFVGSWSGEGVLIGGEEPEVFRCRLTISKGNQAKINFAGRCSLISTNLSVSGTIAYKDEAGQYEAAMSSNAGFTGLAVGKKSGDTITFDLTEKQTDQGGNDVRIGSRIKLIGSNITVEFEIEFNNSGDVLTASVPFSR